MNDILIAGEREQFFPGIFQYDNGNIPWISSPNAECDLSFAMTRDTLLDVEVYKSFLSNAIRRFRATKYYKSYKSYLMGIGLDHCVILGNVDESMAELEMNHNFLTIYDIALMITEHVINTVGYITSFDLIQLLINAHFENRIPIVMMSKTMHQLYHADSDNFVPPNQTFGKWWELLYIYRYGITIDIAKKVIRYIEAYQNEPQGNMFVNMRNDIMSFANYNEYGYPAAQCVTINQNVNQVQLYGGI